MRASPDEKKWLVETGPKQDSREKKAICSTDHPIVTETIIKTLNAGGNAADAAIAGCMTQAAVQLTATNHTGTVAILYYDAKTKQVHELSGGGVAPAHLPIFRTVPSGFGGWAMPGSPAPHACIPGFMPVMGALHERFGSKPWSSLVDDAIYWAEEGHPVSSLEYGLMHWDKPFIHYLPESRELFSPNGHLVNVGERFANPALAETLKGLSDEGPDYFTEGNWGQDFVAYANNLGWEITLSDMTAFPPRWNEPLRYPHKGYEIAQLSPPNYQAVFSGFVLGVLNVLGYQDMEPGSSESIYTMAHTLRWGLHEIGYVNDPEFFGVPADQWLAPTYHRHVASIIANSWPKVDLTDHVVRTGGLAALAAAGQQAGDRNDTRVPQGSCEFNVVDSEGNWVQLMNTAQGGGIPGGVVGGVPMMGSHAQMGSFSGLSSWQIQGIRPRVAIGSTMVLKDGAPIMSLGSPGNCYCTVPQVLSNIIDLGMDPPKAVNAPRMHPLAENYGLSIESRIAPSVVKELTSLGVRVGSMVNYDWDMGSYTVAWRDQESGKLNACVDPRRTGVADGIA